MITTDINTVFIPNCILEETDYRRKEMNISDNSHEPGNNHN